MPEKVGDASGYGGIEEPREPEEQKGELSGHDVSKEDPEESIDSAQRIIMSLKDLIDSGDLEGITQYYENEGDLEDKIDDAIRPLIYAIEQGKHDAADAILAYDDRLSNQIDLKYIEKHSDVSQKVRIAVAKRDVQKGWCFNFSKAIKDYGIEDKKALTEIAKLAAQHDVGFSEFVGNYDITNEKDRIELANIVVQHHPCRISKFIRNYDIQDEGTRIEIVKIVAKLDNNISEFVGNYGIEDEKTIIEIAKLAVQRKCNSVSEYIGNYGIKNEKALIDIAKIAAQNSTWDLSRFIGNYGIEHEQGRMEIAKIAVQQDAQYPIMYLEKYEITDEEGLVEIAKIVVQQSVWFVSAIIKKCGITKEKVLVTMTKLVVQKKEVSASWFVEQSGITDEKALVAIAKLVAQENIMNVEEFVEKSGITGEQGLIEIAKIVVQESVWVGARFVKNCEITDKQALIELAKLAAQNDACQLSECIGNYGITDDEVLIELAKLAVQKYNIFSGGISEHIGNYGIEDQKGLIEIARLAAKESIRAVSRYIGNYGITDQEFLIELARRDVQDNVEHGLQNIKNYKITDEQGLIDIVKSVAKQSGSMVSKHVGQCGITDQKGLVEIAKIVAQSGYCVSEVIGNYNITDEQGLIEIAKLAAQQKDSKVSKFLGNYGITDGQVLIGIATLAVQHDASFCEFVGNYKISDEAALIDEEALIKLAKLAARNACVSAYIRNFGISDPEALKEIAYIAAQKEGSFPEFVGNYGIEDEKVLLELAKFSVQNRAWFFSRHIENFGISDSEALQEIAYLAAQDDYNFSSEFARYGIKDEKISIKLAKLAARNGEVTELIENYSISDPEALKEIAYLAAQYDCGFSEHVKKYGIEDREVLIEMARLAARNDEGSNFSKFIGNFGITDQNVLIETARDAVQYDGNFSKYIVNYGIEDERVRIELAKTAVQNDYDDCIGNIRQYDIIDKEALIEIFQQAVLLSSYDGESVEYYSERFGIPRDRFTAMIEGSELSGEIKTEVQKIRDAVDAEKNPFYKKTMENWLRYTCFALSSFKISEQQFKTLSTFDFFGQVMKYRVPKMRYLLTELMLRDICGKEGLLDRYHEYTTTGDKPKKTVEKFKSGNTKHLNKLKAQWEVYKKGADKEPSRSVAEQEESDARGLIALGKKWASYNAKKINKKYYFPTMLLVLLESQGVKGCKEFCQDFVPKKKSFFGVGGNHVLIDILYTLLKEDKLEPEDKTYLLEVLQKGNPSREEALKRVKTVYGILQSGGEDMLKKDVLVGKQDNLEQIFLEVFRRHFTVGDIENFAEKYHATLGKFRDQTALMTYRGRLERLPPYEQEAVLKELNAFVESVLQGTFHEERYSQSDSEHLRKVFQGRPELEKEWRKGEAQPLQKFIVEKDTEKAVAMDYLDFLQDKIRHGHIVGESYVFLKSFVGSPQDKSRVLEELKQEQAAVTQDKRSLEFQSLCIQLCDDEKSEQEKLQLLRTIQKILPDLSDVDGFKHDIEGAITTVKGFLKKAKLKSYTKWTVEDTDAAQDLVLCGTEVVGSCQNVAGGPGLNQCLMGYIWHGQTKVLVVKDPTGKIVVRSVWRLLLNEAETEPVLFLEKMYTAGYVAEEVQQALVEMAKQRAKQMGSTLLSTEYGKAPYSGVVKSLGGRAPYEYNDAQGGSCKDGIFKITNAKEIIA
jgi:hypothetical protein